MPGPKVRIHEEAKLNWLTPAEKAPVDEVEEFTEGELSVQVRVRELGTADRPQLIELLYLADAEVQLHAHDQDEIVYIREGSMRVGQRMLHAGDSIFIAGGTYYGFRAGPDGLQILNFRPRQDLTFHTRRKA